MFRARQPMFLWWGGDLIQFYNDAYLPSFGRGKHPHAMGQFGRECWREIWPIIGPQIEDVMKRGIASWNEDSLVPILRNGRIEDVYWTYTYSPVFGETGAVEATLVICTETTNRVLGERRANMLHALVGETSVASDRASLIATALATIRRAPADLPFGGFYERDPTTAALVPAATAGMDRAQARAVGERVRAAIARRAGGGAFLISAREAQPATSGGDSADSADDRDMRDIYVAPLPARVVEQPLLLVLGLSPQLSIDEAYRRFLEQVSGHLQLAKNPRGRGGGPRCNRPRAAPSGRAERDRARGAARGAAVGEPRQGRVPGHARPRAAQPAVADRHRAAADEAARRSRDHRASSRSSSGRCNHLVRLVDDLLDVSRITRGKVELRKRDGRARRRGRQGGRDGQPAPRAAPPPTSTSTCRDRALSVDGDPVRLAQVVANLLTNAARYTEPGGDIVAERARASGERRDRHPRQGQRHRHRARAAAADLRSVRAGAPQRRPRARAGSGIGLALVKNLVALHGGSVVGARATGPARERVHGPAAARRRGGSRAAAGRRPPSARRRARPATAGACWSSTTTTTPPSCWPSCCATLGHEVAVA